MLTHVNQISKLLRLVIARRSERSLGGPRCALAALSMQLMGIPLYRRALSSELTMLTGLSCLSSMFSAFHHDV